MPKVSQYTNNNGVRLLSSLFAEMCKTKEQRKGAYYTLKDYDYYDWKSLYLLYMQYADLSEYRFASECLADWQHWELLTNTGWFQPYVERWRKELYLSLQSEALRKVVDESRKPTREGLSAAKYLLERGWEPKSTKGRPTKQQISDTAHALATEKQEINDQMVRLGIDGGILENRSK